MWVKLWGMTEQHLKIALPEFRQERMRIAEVVNVSGHLPTLRLLTLQTRGNLDRYRTRTKPGLGLLNYENYEIQCSFPRCHTTRKEKSPKT
jgi:hypothetical protein